jgi:hypothetical protein
MERGEWLVVGNWLAPLRLHQETLTFNTSNPWREDNNSKLHGNLRGVIVHNYFQEKMWVTMYYVEGSRFPRMAM